MAKTIHSHQEEPLLWVAYAVFPAGGPSLGWEKSAHGFTRNQAERRLIRKLHRQARKDERRSAHLRAKRARHEKHCVRLQATHQTRQVEIGVCEDAANLHTQNQPKGEGQ
jgi:hypothetical protein